jgi:hypothetical protein
VAGLVDVFRDWQFLAPYIALTAILMYRVGVWAAHGDVGRPDFETLVRAGWQDPYFASLANVGHLIFVAATVTQADQAHLGGVLRQGLFFGLPVGAFGIFLGLYAVRKWSEAERSRVLVESGLEHQNVVDDQTNAARAATLGLWILTFAITVFATGMYRTAQPFISLKT